MGEERITMTLQEQRRAQVLTWLAAGQSSQAEAAQILGLSVRHVRRLAAAYAADGPATLVHGNRGRSPAHRITAAVRAQVGTLARDMYAGFNQQHLNEKLAEEEGIRLGQTTVRRILAQAGVARPRRRRPPKHRGRRERMAQGGMLLQADGSRHRWLGSDRPSLTPIGLIDDATGTVPGAVFREQEDAAGHLDVLRPVVEAKGIPPALNVDRHGIFECDPLEPQTLRVSGCSASPRRRRSWRCGHAPVAERL
jgi:transposase